MDEPLSAAKISKQWLASRVLNAATLDNLYCINRIFLDTLAASSPRPRALSETSLLTQQIVAGIADLSCERRRTFAQSPFSLFDAQFSAGAFWTQLICSVREPMGPALEGSDPTGLKSFSQLALFYAWHVARVDSLAARIFLGMSQTTQEVFAQLSLPHLQQLALTQPSLVTPRWSDRSTVWQILLGSAHLGANHLAQTRMLGIQLIAGDLAAASGTR